MDRQRHALAAYEYLCHVGEAQQWIEGCLDEELEFGVTEMEEGLRDGVVLAKLARVFQGESVVKSIWTVSGPGHRMYGTVIDGPAGDEAQVQADRQHQPLSQICADCGDARGA
jgi:hypothetical protein